MQQRSDKFLVGRGAMEKFVRYACHVLVLFVVLADCLPPISEPVINTQWGPIRGKWSNSLNGRPVANFLGIPYALPPVGDLRFQSPQRWNRTWTTVRDGTVDGQECTQFYKSKVLGGEDCLYLNIFTPVFAETRLAKLPVIVYVHGGKFATGASYSTLYAPDYLSDYNVILVTLNYRLNVLGFFSTTNRVAPGNYGLKDVVTALHWVQENIHDFGGNPESVTAMGSSSGAATVHLLALTNKTEGLFHRYILHSGTALNPWAVHSKQPYRQTCLKLASLVGCLPNTTVLNKTIFAVDSEEKIWRYNDMYDTSGDNEKQDEEMMKCMRNVDTNKMLKMTQKMYVWMTSPSCQFTPTLEEESEDAVVTMHPFKVMKDGLFRDLPALILVTKNEGLIVSQHFFNNYNTVNEMILNFEEYLPYTIDSQEVICNTSIFADAIRDFYLNGSLTESNLLNNITDILGDGLFTWPLFQSIQYQSKMGKANVYFSFFSYQGTFSFTFDSSPHIYGVSHADDLNYFFPMLNNMYADMMLQNTEDDLKMINIMSETWTNFMKYGIPSASMIPEWPNYRDHQQFIRFGIDKSPDIAVQADFLPVRMKFWEKLMPIVSTKCNV